MSSSEPVPGACPLCREPGGRPVHDGPLARVVRVDDPAFPAFYRVILQRHVGEMSDLRADERHALMDTVVRVEAVLREALSPTKINLASLGNMVPHLHWHVVARFDWDSHFPDPIWAAPRRPAPSEALAALAARLPAVDARLAQALA